MSESGAVGVIFLSFNLTRDMNCIGTECETQLDIPATSVYLDRHQFDSFKAMYDDKSGL